jgi:hypothetical protein
MRITELIVSFVILLLTKTKINTALNAINLPNNPIHDLPLDILTEGFIHSIT